MNINGYCHPELALVETVFAEIMQHPEQRGAGLCVQMDGEVLVDLWAGFQDRQQTVKWQANTLVNVFSAGKPFAAVMLLLLVAQGKLELDTPIIQYWQTKPRSPPAIYSAISLGLLPLALHYQQSYCLIGIVWFRQYNSKHRGGNLVPNMAMHLLPMAG